MKTIARFLVEFTKYQIGKWSLYTDYYQHHANPLYTMIFISYNVKTKWMETLFEEKEEEKKPIICFPPLYFLKMSESIQSVVELRGLKAATMEVLLEFIYTEQVEVTVENVQELLPAACLLQLKGHIMEFVLYSVYVTWHIMLPSIIKLR